MKHNKLYVFLVLTFYIITSNIHVSYNKTHLNMLLNIPATTCGVSSSITKRTTRTRHEM